MALLICRTCPRYDTRATGGFSRALTTAIADDPDAEHLHVRFVQCLGGCPDDGVIALDGPGKARVRFTGLDAGHAAAAVTAARSHDACATGEPEDWTIPPELAGRLSAVTLKRRA
jgi:predicted metal-binding protein